MASKRTKTIANFLLSVLASIVAALVMNWTGLVTVDMSILKLGGNVGPFLMVLIILPAVYILLRVTDLIVTIIDFFQDLFNLS